MSGDDDRDEPGAPAPPDAATLASLETDAWAALLPHVRAVLDALPEAEVNAVVARLRAASTGQLAGGPRRRELSRLLAQGGRPWRDLHATLVAADDLPSAVAELVRGGTPDDAEPRRQRADPAASDTTDDLDRLRDRVRTARGERDAWRRRAEGERARSEALEARLEGLQSERDELEQQLERVRLELSSAAEDRSRAIAREKRRRDGELRALRDEIAALRRADEDRKARIRRRADERRREQQAAEEAEHAERAAARSAAPARIVPGRPSTLPAGVVMGTTEAAALLLHRGRLVLVDGYNVSLRHRGHLDLETQRTWLVRLLSTLATRRGIRPVVVFDGERAGGGRPPAGLRDVEVRFTSAGVTADDEIVLAVEGTDEPVVVVTDDRELVARVTIGGADVLATGQLLGVAS